MNLEEKADNVGFLELPEDEQWRLINETGVLNRLPSTKDEDNEEDTPLAEEIFSAVTLIIPFSFLLLMMDMYVLSLLSHRSVAYRPSLAQSNPPSIWKATDYPSVGGPNDSRHSKYVSNSLDWFGTVLDSPQVISIFIFYSTSVIS
jgi:hypothetical protein